MTEYLERYQKLKKRYSKRKNQTGNLQMEVRPDDFIILNHIYPRIYSANIELKGNINDPKVEFNAVTLS